MKNTFKNASRFIRNLTVLRILALMTVISGVCTMYFFATGGTWTAALSVFICIVSALSYGAKAESTVKVYGAMQWW